MERRDTGISIGIYALAVAAVIGSPFVLKSPVAFRSTFRGLSLGCTPVRTISPEGFQAPIPVASFFAVSHSEPPLACTESSDHDSPTAGTHADQGAACPLRRR